jgi:hypothetical protein
MLAPAVWDSEMEFFPFLRVFWIIPGCSERNSGSNDEPMHHSKADKRSGPNRSFGRSDWIGFWFGLRVCEGIGASLQSRVG